MRRPSLSFVALAFGIAQGCAATTPPKPAPRSARTTDGGPAFESPAKWLAFPQTVGQAMAALALDDGRCLVLTDDGQRWVVTPKDKAQACVGTGVASGSPTLEPLVGAQKLGAEFRFVAEGGAVYTSRDANGPFSKFAKAPTYLRRVTARGNAIVGLDESGGTFFYDGATWKPATLPKGARGIDVAADDKGRVLWVGAPESMLVSNDGGHTFEPLAGAAPPRVGAYEAGFTVSGKLAARGALGNIAWEAGGLSRTTEKMSDVHVPDVAIEPTVGPRASMVSEDRAVLDGARYYELVQPYEGSRHGLMRAALGGPFEKIALEELESCDNVKVTARGGLLAFACTKQIEDRPSLTAELYVSKDGGLTLELVGSLFTPTYTDLALSLAHDGSIMVVGACKPPGAKSDDKASKDDKPADEASVTCNPKAPLIVRAGSVTSGTTQGLEEGSARSPLLSPDGRTAYFLGRSRKDSQQAVFVSRDGGHAFQMRPIEPPQSSSWEDDDPSGSGEVEGAYVRPLYLADAVSLTMDETGTLGVVGERDVGSAWVTLDADGRIANVGEPPEPSYMMGGVGNRVVALGYGQVDGVLRGYESVDGGVTWAEITTTPAVQRFGERGGTFSCSQGGCILGDELVRVGWEGQSETPFTAGEGLFPTPAEPTLATPISCQLAPKSEWVGVEGRPEERAATGSYTAYNAGPALPRLRDIARGKVLFSVATIGEDGHIDVTMATLPDKESGPTALTKKTLFGPAKSGKGGFIASTLRAQAEGYVALRATIPVTKSGSFDPAKKMDGFEVAWQNQFTGTIGKKGISFDANWTPNVTTGATLKPSLLTIAMQGVIAQMPSTKAVYTDSSSSLTFDYPSLLAVVTDARPVGEADATYLGGRPFALAVVDRSPTARVVLLAPASTKGKGKESAIPPAQALTIAPALSDVEWMYTSDRVGFAALLGSPNEETPPSAVGFLIEPDGTFGPTFELPTLGDLADRPQPCGAEDRKTTPRTVSPHFGRASTMLFQKSRHAIIVSDAPSGAGPSLIGGPAMEPIWLLTDGAVLHGTKKSPCLSAWHGAGTRPGFVAIIGGNPEQSWLLRTTSGTKVPPKGKPGTGKWAQQVEARPMICKYQSDLSVPYEVASRAGQRLSDDQP